MLSKHISSSLVSTNSIVYLKKLKLINLKKNLDRF